MQDLAKNDGDRQVLEFISADTAISRPLVTNAGVPRERVAALRRAFDATMKDPEFLAEAGKLNMDVHPIDSKGMEHLIAELYATPRDVVEKAAQAITK